MRRTLTRLAAVGKAGDAAAGARYLEPGWPTGLTGLTTHPAPRATLLYLYAKTLDKLKAVPETSLYRQSVEAVTKHRMSIVRSVVPPGYPEWLEKTKSQLASVESDKEFRVRPEPGVAGYDNGLRAVRVDAGNMRFVLQAAPEDKDERLQEWDGEKFLTRGFGEDPPEGAHMERLAKALREAGAKVVQLSDEQEEKVAENGGILNDAASVASAPKEEDAKEPVVWDPEPQLTADQLSFCPCL